MSKPLKQENRLKANDCRDVKLIAKSSRLDQLSSNLSTEDAQDVILITGHHGLAYVSGMTVDGTHEPLFTPTE